MGIVLQMEGDDLVLRYLQGIQHRSFSLKQPFDEIGQYLVSETQLRFSRGVGPDGHAWKPSQRVLKHGGQTLLKSGRLMKSITHQSSDRMLEVGSNVVYAAIHQLGGHAGRNHAAYIPPRPYLGLTRTDENEMLNILQHYIIPGV